MEVETGCRFVRKISSLKNRRPNKRRKSHSGSAEKKTRFKPQRLVQHLLVKATLSNLSLCLLNAMCRKHSLKTELRIFTYSTHTTGRSSNRNRLVCNRRIQAHIRQALSPKLSQWCRGRKMRWVRRQEVTMSSCQRLLLRVLLLL